MPIVNLIVDEENTGVRLDVFLSENTPLSRTFIQKLIESEKVTLNGEIPNKKIKTELEDRISLTYEEKTPTDLKPENIPLDIIWEDENMLVINKPSGMLTHPTTIEKNGTLVNALLYKYGENLSDLNGEFRRGIVHRLDRNTTGLIIYAKNKIALDIKSL